jgi:hypothetical protein
MAVETFALNTTVDIRPWAKTAVVRGATVPKAVAPTREDERRFSQTTAVMATRLDDDALFAGPSVLDAATAARAAALRAQPRTELPARPVPINEP